MPACWRAPRVSPWPFSRRRRIGLRRGIACSSSPDDKVVTMSGLHFMRDPSAVVVMSRNTALLLPVGKAPRILETTEPWELGKVLRAMTRPVTEAQARELVDDSTLEVLREEGLLLAGSDPAQLATNWVPASGQGAPLPPKGRI